MALQVFTARLGYRGPLRWLDVSLQGNTRRVDQGQPGGQDGLGFWLAPSPQLLYPYLSKRRFNKLTSDDWPRYVEGYTALMRERYRDPRTRRVFDELLAREHVVLLCFCTDAAQCHRRVLAGILVKLGAVDQGEIEVPAKTQPIPAAGEILVGSGDRCVPAVMNLGTNEQPQLVGATFCRGRGRRKNCKACGARATKLCDFPLSGAKAGKTCDADICDRCATRIDTDVDYCPPHARLARSDSGGAQPTEGHK